MGCLRTIFLIIGIFIVGSFFAAIFDGLLGGNNTYTPPVTQVKQEVKKQPPKEVTVNKNCDSRFNFIITYWDTANANMSEGEKLINEFYNDGCSLGAMDRNAALADNARQTSERLTNTGDKIVALNHAYNYAIKSNQDWIADNYAVSIGKLYYEIYNYQNALEWYKKVLPSYNKYQHQPYLLPAFMADCYVGLYDYGNARRLYNEALENLQNNWNEQNLQYYNEIQAKLEYIQNK